MFITFNTISQAQNFVKRQKAYQHQEGCGCCYFTHNYFIDKNKVMELDVRSYQGHVTTTITVIGRIKKWS